MTSVQFHIMSHAIFYGMEWPINTVTTNSVGHAREHD